MNRRTSLVCLIALAASGCAARGSGALNGPGLGAAAGQAAGGREAPASGQQAAPASRALGEDSGLEDYLARAALNNPGLRSAFYRWQAATERPAQARSLPDPMLSFGYFIREVETRVGPQQARLGLSQTIPWPGKLVLAGQAAEKASEAARRRYEAEKLKTFFRVKDAYYEYWYLARAVEITRANADLVARTEEVARTRYKAAAAGHPDVIRAQVELGKLQDRLRSLEDLRPPVVARLNAVLDRPAEAPLPWPKSAPPRVTPGVADAEVLAGLRAANPELAALEAEIAAADRAVRLARQSHYPDFTVGVDYVFTDEPDGPMPGDDRGKDAVLFGVGVSLPIWVGRNRAGVREAQDRLWAARLTRKDRENMLLARAKKTLYEIRDAERKIELYGGTLIPKAEQAHGAAEAAFRAGTIGFSDLIDAERVLLEFRLTHERARSHQAQRVAELEMLAGRALPLRERATVAPEEGEEQEAPEAGGGAP